MKKILFLGNSICAAKAIEDLRLVDQTSEIALFSLDGGLPFRADLIAEVIAKNISESNVLYKSLEFYKTNNVNLILDQKLGKIDFRRKQIVTEDKKVFPFDILVITKMPPRLPEIKGDHREGIFDLQKFSDITALQKQLPITESVAFKAETLEGVRAACALAEREKEVICDCFSLNSSGALDQSTLQALNDFMNTNSRIRFVFDYTIDEILGEIEVKAVRFKGWKVIACQALVFEKGALDMRLLKDSALTLENNRIAVDSSFKTNLDGIYAAGEACFSHAATQELESQGKALVASLIGQPLTI